MQTRPLVPGDEARVERFLHPFSTALFLRSNLAAVGLVDGPESFKGTWVGAFTDGELCGVVCHAWNGFVMLQASEGLTELATAAVDRSGRPVHGLSGPAAAVRRVRAHLGLQDRQAMLHSDEILYEVHLDAVRWPDRTDLDVRRATDADIDCLARWRAAYRVETLGQPSSPDLVERSAVEVARSVARGTAFVGVRRSDEERVATSGFNATLPDVVQIGGVFTPPALRSRGYARAVVAGSLALARAEGVARSVLFTPQDNIAAQRAYEGIGYQSIGDYGLVIFSLDASR